jgi:hypothetical protein
MLLWHFFFIWDQFLVEFIFLFYLFVANLFELILIFFFPSILSIYYRNIITGVSFPSINPSVIIFFYYQRIYRRTKNYRWNIHRQRISVSDFVGKLITDGICVLRRRKNSVGKTVKSCSDLKTWDRLEILGWYRGSCRKTANGKIKESCDCPCWLINWQNKKKNITKAVFVSWKLVSEKSLFKLSCVSLPVGKLINRKHFPVNGKHFPVKEKFGLVCFSGKCFSFILSGKHFVEVVKNLEMLYYLLIISNLVLKLLIAIYILFWIFIFQFDPLEFNFYINFGRYFCNCYLLFPYYFLIEIFYLSNLILILLIVTYFIWNNLWNVNYYYFNFFIFQFFLFLRFDLYYFDYFFLFEIIYEIIYFFNFILIQLFNL